MFAYMSIITVIVCAGLLVATYLTYKLADMVINFRLLFLYLFRYKLTTKEKNFLFSFKSYIHFLVHYEYMLTQCDFFGIDKPDNVRDGLEIVIELSSYN